MKIGVYGAGRFGSFWADLMARDNDVTVWDPCPRVNLARARMGSESEVLNADYLFFCVPISRFRDVLASVADRIGPRTAVLDTCSVKAHPSYVMSRVLGNERPFLGTHPMFGPDSARNGVSGLPMVITPVSEAPDQAFGPLIEYWKDLGLDLVTMSPEEHDREAAYTQGITHFIGRVLQDMELSESSIATLGFKKLLEIREQTCNDPVQLFEDLQHYNPYTSAMRSDLKHSMDRIMEQLVSSGLDSQKAPLYDKTLGDDNV